MGDAFTNADWAFIQSMAKTTLAQLRAKGMREYRTSNNDFNPMPPIPGTQVAEFENATNFSLPKDFVDLVTKFSGGWTYHWTMCVNQLPFKMLKSPVYSPFGGTCEVPFIGASKSRTLLLAYSELQADFAKHYRRSDEQRATDPALFPLSMFASAGGDLVALRLDRTPVEVLFLDHEGGHEVRGKDIIGIGFREFVMAWAHLGFPEYQYLGNWMDRATNLPDEKGMKADLWRAWLADANVRELVDAQGKRIT